MSLIGDIRGALQLQAVQATGFPASSQIDYEGMGFSPTVGVPWARMTLLTNSRRPFSLSGDTAIVGGLFQVDLFYPVNINGTATAETVADAVVGVFQPGLILLRGSARVAINYAQNGGAVPSADSIHIPITISWRCVS